MDNNENQDALPGKGTLDYSMPKAAPAGGGVFKSGELDYTPIVTEQGQQPKPGELDYSSSMGSPASGDGTDELEPDFTDADNIASGFDGESFDEADTETEDEAAADLHSELSGYVDTLAELAEAAGDYDHDYRDCLDGPITENLCEATRQMMLLESGEFSKLGPDLVKYAETANMDSGDLAKLKAFVEETDKTSPMFKSIAKLVIQKCFQQLNGK